MLHTLSLFLMAWNWAIKEDEGIKQAMHIAYCRITFLSKDPSPIHACNEEGGRLSDTHQKVSNGQINNEHVGWCS